MSTSRRVGTVLVGALLAASLATSGCTTAPVTGTSQQLAPGAPAGPVAGLEITTQPADATISRYGTRTSTTFVVVATGSNKHYRWQAMKPSATTWSSITGATSSRYTAKATTWPDDTRFRVVVIADEGRLVSAEARLTVLFPSKTPAADAVAQFGLTGLTQGVDLSAYQYVPGKRISVAAVDAWAGADGFALHRLGSGSRPRYTTYVDLCTGLAKKTGSKPITRDCAYGVLSDRIANAGLRTGHYWFNGWIRPIDTTSRQLFAGGYTPEASAKQFVAWLLADGHYTKSSTDPLVLDIEPGRSWTKYYNGKKYVRTLRAWTPAEALQFLTTVRTLLTGAGYQANLYVYMSANRASALDSGGYAWRDVAAQARLWIAYWGLNNGRIPEVQPWIGPWAEQGGWSIWQYSSNVRISGSNVGAIDGDIAQADAWTPKPTQVESPAPSPTPTP